MLCTLVSRISVQVRLFNFEIFEQKTKVQKKYENGQFSDKPQFGIEYCAHGHKLLFFAFLIAISVNLITVSALLLSREYGIPLLCS